MYRSDVPIGSIEDVAAQRRRGRAALPPSINTFSENNRVYIHIDKVCDAHAVLCYIQMLGTYYRVYNSLNLTKF